MKKIVLTVTLVITSLLNHAQVVTTFAGSGTIGSTNATGTAATFNSPTGICTDAAGNIYVADRANHKIRKISLAGTVTTFAGAGVVGSTDATGAAASFWSPRGVCSDLAGDIYVADTNNNKIRKITAAGVVTTFAGSGITGTNDGTGIAASFNNPVGICSDVFGNIYVTDGNSVRKITSAGVVTTFAGSTGSGSTDATGIAASFYWPYGICTDASGNIYVADFNNKKIRKITVAGVVTTFAGSGLAGSTDATGTAASFNGPFGIYSDAAGNIYVAEQQNHKIRKITAAGVVTTIAGTGMTGAIDATGTSASFNFPTGICADASGNLYVADVNNNKIRKIDALSTNITDIGISNSNIQLYPNPSSSLLTIQTNEVIESISIYNSLGSLIQTENKTTFSVEQLPAGIYNIQIKTIKGFGTTRFIKE